MSLYPPPPGGSGTVGIDARVRHIGGGDGKSLCGRWPLAVLWDVEAYAHLSSRDTRLPLCKRCAAARPEGCRCGDRRCCPVHGYHHQPHIGCVLR